MSLAPLPPARHVVPSNRLAFTTPVREAGGAGHWITLGHHGDDEEGGGVHVYVGGGSGPGSGTITRGPKGLLGHHIGAVASHPNAGKVKHHPAGHDPPGARDHPHYAEAEPKAPAKGKGEGEEAAKRAGKPYARLHGAEQGTRTEQIGKALSEAQGAAQGAKGAKAEPPGSEAWSPQTRAEVQGTQLTDAHRAYFREHPHILDAIRQSVSPEHFATKAPSVASTSSRRTRLSPEENARRFKDYQDTKALGFLHHEKGIEPRIRGSLWTHGQKYLQEQHEAGTGAPAEGTRRATGFDNPVSATARMADKAEATLASGGVAKMADTGAMKEKLRAKVEAARAAKAARQQHADVADTAVAHQQAQAELAAHRAANDRNPNPWAPHLSPPVGDAKDKELAEKATRAQLAHQAAQAQQQGAQQQAQTDGQRAHEKDMVRVKAEATHQAAPLVPLKGRLAGLMSPEEQARLQAEHAARPQQGLPEQPTALPPKEGTLLRDQPSPSGKRRLEVPQPAPQPQAAQPAGHDEPLLQPDGTYRTRQQYDLAQAVGRDAANGRMRSEGRTTWNEDDYNHHLKVMNDFLDRNLDLGRPARQAKKKSKVRESATAARGFSAPVATRDVLCTSFARRS